MKKFVFGMLLAVIVILLAGYILYVNKEKEAFNQGDEVKSGDEMYEESISSGDTYVEDKNLDAGELFNLCNKYGSFIIRKKLGNNTFLVHILSENDIAMVSGEKEIIREGGIEYGEEALDSTSVLKVNQNAASWLTNYTEGMQYAWMFYRKENDDVIYVPNPQVEYAHYPVVESVSSKLEIINDTNHEIWEEKFPISITARIFDQYDIELERNSRVYEESTFPTILYRAMLTHENFENLVEYGNEISSEDYEERINNSDYFLELKYDDKIINIFPADFTQFDALIEENGKYYVIENGTLDEWNVTMLFISLNLF